MESVFLKLLNMSIAAGWLILAVLALRLPLSRAPKSARVVLWALAGVRLICPFSFESALSLIPSAHTVSPEIFYAEAPAIRSGVSVLNRAINPVLSASLAPAAGASANPTQIAAYVAALIWLAGMGALALYSAVSYVRLRRKVAEAVPLGDNLWLSERIPSPFVLGLFRPHIYLPPGLDGESLAHVIAHERAHIARRDHWWKPIGFLLLAVHWFNPLVWLAYVLLCRDIELACDERVIREMGPEQKKAYSAALLSCSAPRRMISACPLAFGESGVRRRISNVLNYRKPAFWITAAALVACVAAALCFLTNPREGLPSSLRSALEQVTVTGAETLDLRRSSGPVARALSGAECDELSSRLRDLKSLHRDDDYGGFTPFYSLSIEAEGLPRFKIAGYSTEGDRVALMIGNAYYRVEDSDFARYLSLVCAGGNIEQATEVTSYVSETCLYMNPFSSVFAADDSGCRYLIGAHLDEGIFIIQRKVTGEVLDDFSPVEWSWQEISLDEWQALFLEVGTPPDIGAYSHPLMMRLSEQYALFDMDGAYWLMELRTNPQSGLFAWSLYSLTPGAESTAIGENPAISVPSPDGRFLAEAYGSNRGVTAAGLYPYETARLVRMSDGAVVWSDIGYYVMRFLWSPDSEYVAVYREARTYGEAIVVSSQTGEAIPLPGTEELLARLGGTEQADMGRFDPYIEVAEWLDDSTVLVHCRWSTGGEEPATGNYTYDLRTGALSIEGQGTGEPVSYTYDDSAREVKFSLTYPLGWKLIEQRGWDGDATREASPDTGIMFDFSANADGTESFSVAAMRFSTLGFGQEDYVAEDFVTDSGLAGKKYTQLFGEHISVFYIFGEELDAPPHYFAAVNMSEAMYEKYRSEIERVMKSFTVLPIG